MLSPPTISFSLNQKRWNRCSPTDYVGLIFTRCQCITLRRRFRIVASVASENCWAASAAKQSFFCELELERKLWSLCRKRRGEWGETSPARTWGHHASGTSRLPIGTKKKMLFCSLQSSFHSIISDKIHKWIRYSAADSVGLLRLWLRLRR